MKNYINNSWQDHLAEEFQQEYFQQLVIFLKQEYQTQQIYPLQRDIFQAFEQTPYEHVRVVILGQDPYHGAGQAHGLSFSVLPGIKLPPSLRNIFKELSEDIDMPLASTGDLTAWAKQGVFLLNTVLTVREGQANSHQGKGWEKLTDRVIEKLNAREEPIIFVLWGKQAQDKKKMIDVSKHAILEAPHPSPLSAYRGFFGSKPFSQINQQLVKWNTEKIDWHLD